MVTHTTPAFHTWFSRLEGPGFRWLGPNPPIQHRWGKPHPPMINNILYVDVSWDLQDRCWICIYIYYISVYTYNIYVYCIRRYINKRSQKKWINHDPCMKTVEVLSKIRSFQQYPNHLFQPPLPPNHRPSPTIHPSVVWAKRQRLPLLHLPGAPSHPSNKWNYLALSGAFCWTFQNTVHGMSK